LPLVMAAGAELSKRLGGNPEGLMPPYEGLVGNQAFIA